MKFLFDFDGVLTNQTEEALRVKAIFAETLSRITGLEEQAIRVLLAQGESAMDSSPDRHGWMSRGRVTAFANEDLFIRVNGLAACLDQWAYEGQTGAREMLQAVRATGLESFFALAQLAYQQMVGETQSGKLKPIDPKTAPLMQKLLEAGHTAVVVSNSGTERILQLLQGAGIEAVAHTADPSARIRVRGDARKFELGEFSRSFQAGCYRVEVARPVYEAILREERPGAVVGDVFTLDLALPLHLARTEPMSFGGMNLFLRTQHYTPSWSREFMASSKESSAKLRLLDDIQQLIDFVSASA